MVSAAVKSLRAENSSDLFVQACDVLLRVANNIIKEPGNERYRRLKISNSLVRDKLIPVAGAMETLFEMGFVDSEDSESLVLPSSASMAMLQNIHDQLLVERAQLGNLTPAPAPQAPQTAMAQTPVGGAVATVASPQLLMLTQLNFLKKLETSLTHVQLYEQSFLQEKARAVIPIVRLETQAKQKQDNLPQDVKDVGFKDLLLLELLAWFKEDFFRWVDAPPCEHCGGVTEGADSVLPSEEEKANGASRVENYKCKSCMRHTRFPRYNNPGRLLETRRGRCGEWANCFTLCAISVGFEARYVLDWTDHVWTEVWSEVQDRWLHVDPCENACDKPLIYENGWGKKLTYIIAFAQYDIQDVTWRYSSKHQELLSRRRECSEQWLVATIVRLRKDLQRSLLEARKKALQNRLCKEICELMVEKKAGDGESVGRQSGSMGWRMARGETGDSEESFKSITITPEEGEMAAKQLRLSYSCADDTYNRPNAGNSKVKGWKNMVHDLKDVARKEEKDWKMCYLARVPGKDVAIMAWKFDFSDTPFVIDTVIIKALSKRFESGQIVWRVCSDDQCAFLPPDGTEVNFDVFRNATHLSITAHLRGGEGDQAWQHTQLFRQALDDTSEPFDVVINLKSKQ